MSTSENDDKTLGQTFYETLDACGGTVFPVRQSFEDGSFTYFSGLTVRDWFAGQVMAGLYAAQIHGMSGTHWEQFVRIAYEQADAMLKHRETRNGTR